MSAREEQVILGIDLGTTFSAMAIVDRFGRPAVIMGSDGGPTTPSVVYFFDSDAYVVGQEAVKMVVADPTNVARFVKRSMGEEDFSLEYFGQSYTPQELSAIILRHLKNDAEEFLGHPVNRAVISVPAYFNAAQRAATAEAGAIAGLEVLSIINEPTAAAIAYGLDRLGGSHDFLVFDLGGGTFDVTIMRIEGHTLRAMATDGNAELGGKDWDDRLVSHVAEAFVARYGVDPRDDPQPYQEVYERCLAAKLALSTQPRAVIPVNHRGRRMAVTISAPEYTELCRDLLDQCSTTCELVLEKAGLTWRDLDDVVLVGGATRMPMIHDELRRRWGRAPNSELNPDECVALGAALAAVYRHQSDHPAFSGLKRVTLLDEISQPSLDGPSPEGYAEAPTDPPERRATETDPEGVVVALPGLTITDIATHPLGIIVLDASLRERIVELIPEGTPLPTEQRGRFAYAYDNMTAVRVQITEGHGISRDEVMVIGDVILDLLPPRPRGTPIDVVYRYTADQILEVDIIDVETRASRSATISLRGGLGPERVAKAKAHMNRANFR
ncbi:MAG: Hsp70 family protein [Pseudomonadota bacterium]